MKICVVFEREWESEWVKEREWRETQRIRECDKMRGREAQRRGRKRDIERRETADREREDEMISKHF